MSGIAQVTDVANAFSTTLTAGISATDTTITVDSTGDLTAPCYLIIEPLSGTKREVVLCDSNVTATTFVLSGVSKRGLDAPAVSHLAGAKVISGPVAQHIDDLNARVDDVDRQLTVGASEPGTPQTGDLWVDTTAVGGTYTGDFDFTGDVDIQGTLGNVAAVSGDIPSHDGTSFKPKSLAELDLLTETAANGAYAQVVGVDKALAGTGDIAATVQALIDAQSGRRALIYFPAVTGSTQYEFSSDLDVKRCVLVGGYSAGNAGGGGTILHFNGTSGIYSSTQDNFGFGLFNLTVEGANGGTVATTGQTLVDFTGQNYPRLRDVTVRNGDTGILLAQGTTTACNYGSFLGVNVNKCRIGWDTSITNGVGCNTHQFTGGRVWACTTGAVIKAGLTNFVFTNAFESCTLYGVDSTGTNITFMGARFENAAATANVKIRSGAGAHWRFGNHWSSGVDIIDDNYPSVVYGMDRVSGTEQSAPISPSSSRNVIANGLFKYDTDSDGVADDWILTWSSSVSHSASLVASSEEGNWQRIVNTSSNNLRLEQRPITVVPNEPVTIRLRYRVDSGSPILRVGDGTSGSSTLLSMPLTSDATEREWRFTVTPTTSSLNLTLYNAGTSACDFRVTKVDVVMGVASPAALAPRPLTEDGGKVYGKVRTVAGLGVGNSAAATTLGTLSKKMEVFDAAGTSIGFVPIYTTIT